MKRKKEMIAKIFFNVLILSIICLNLVNADVLLGNRSHQIESSYGTGEKISGWINISLDEEPATSLLTGFDTSLSLKEFLDRNSVDYSCSPIDCNSGYYSTSTQTSKTFNLNANEKKTIGIKITGSVSQINSLSFNISTNAGKSCLNPIAIDLFDDGDKEWKAETVSDDYSCIIGNYYGCYNSADNSGKYSITRTRMCEQMNLVPPSKAFEIGADILKKVDNPGTVFFKLELNIGSYSKTCTANASNSGKISCKVELSQGLSEDTEADVCLSIIDSVDNNKFEMNYENKNACGYIGSEIHDFPIFIKSGKFKEISSVNFNNNLVPGINLGNKLSDYILDKYSGNCENDCIIPVSIIAGINQTIILSNLNLVYNTNLNVNTINDIAKEDALIDMDYHKLDLAEAEIPVPSSTGTKNLVFKIGDEEIFDEDVVVKELSTIEDIIPHDFPALVPVNFIVLAQNKTNATYTWDFGDGSKNQITSKNSVTHTYSSLGNYEIKVKITTKTGEITKSVIVSAGSPKNYVNSTIIQYKNDLKNVKIQMIILPAFIKSEVEKNMNLTEIENKIKEQETNYAKAVNEDDYTRIMEALNELKIPYTLNISRTIRNMNFALNGDQINTEVLKNAGAGDFNEEENYFNAINSWMLENLAVTFESKTYSFYMRDNTEEKYSDVKVNINPKKEVKEVYFIVNGDVNRIVFNNQNSANINDMSEAVLFSSLKDAQTIEFIYPEKINPLNLPVVISTSLKNLPVNPEINCNNNNECEAGETYKNCPKDCKKSWGGTLFILGILLFIAFVVYIIMQEWYKRHYESSLFPNRNDLFNLVHFMNNSENQGLKKGEIFGKLKDLRWDGEQLTYAWNKLHGYRTGMWEIPIFKWVENKQVKTELEKRQGMNRMNIRPGYTGFNPRRF